MARIRSTQSLSRVAQCLLVVLGLMSFPVLAEEGVKLLELGQKFDDSVEPNGSSDWYFDVESDRYVEIRAESKTAEVGFHLFRPGETEPFITRTPEGYSGFVAVRFLSDIPGRWRISVFPDPSQQGGEYAVSRIDTRIPEGNDRLVVENEARIHEGLADVRAGRYNEGERKLRDAQQAADAMLEGDYADAINIRNLIADFYYDRGRYAEALTELKLVGEYQTAVSGAIGLRTLNNIGTVAHNIDDYALAIDYLERSVALRGEQLGENHPRVGISLDNLAIVYLDMGRYAEAEQLLLRAKRIFEQSLGEDHYYVSWPMQFLGRVYFQQGRLDEAEQSFLGAIELREAKIGPNASLTLVSKTSLSHMYIDLGRYEDAARLLDEIADAQADVDGPDHPNIANTYASQGEIAYFLGNYEDSLAYFQQARDINAAIYGEEARTLINDYWLARVRHEMGEVAIDTVIDVLLRYESVVESHGRNTRNTEVMRSRLAQSLEQAGQRRKAIRKMEQAIEMAENRRRDAGAIESDVASVSESWRPRYDDIVAWLFDEGELDKAFAFSERARSRVMLDQLAAGQIDIKAGLDEKQRQDLEARELYVRTGLAETRARISALQADRKISPAQRSAEIAELERVLARTQKEYRNVYRDIRRASSLVNRHVTSEGEILSARALSRALAEDTAALSYFVGYERSFLFLVQKGEPLVAWELNMPGDETDLSAEDLRQLLLASKHLSRDRDTRGLVSVESEWQEDRQNDLRLRRTILPDEAWKLLESYNKVVILPDGSLGRLPFEALVIDESDSGVTYWLDEGPAVSYSPSGTVYVNILNREKFERPESLADVLTVFDPLFDVADVLAAQDEQQLEVTQMAALSPGAINQLQLNRSAFENAGGTLRRLPGTAAEGEALIDAFGRSESRRVVDLSGLEATERNTRLNFQGKRFVHFGTHGLTDEGRGSLFAALALTPPASAADLGPDNDGFLELHEIYDLPMNGVELAVLSACETNVGTEVTGEGAFTLARGFLASGAQRVVSSQWAVNDAATAELIGRFFEAVAEHDYRGEQPDYATLLRNAKRELRQSDEWSDPYYWAAFVLSGMP